MTAELFLALTLFALSTLYTPGPNNLMLMASGANYGLRRTVPHLLGVALGFPLLAMAVGFGIAALFRAVPAMEVVLKVLAVAFLLWLAWKVGTSAPPEEAKAEGRPLTFAQATAFQWVNPKAWAMALGAMTAFAASGGFAQVLIVAATFAAFGLGSATAWTAIGTQIRRILSTPRRLRAFNWTMAALLVLSLFPILGTDLAPS
ncbi:threonine/homoserine/homoserine lactone efflux protein [Hasllibacter halocynthiae]|uniref:Threonine/homoserine/homoserine lactone efflux protein n=1 Tax=Hasllibacter halocynthiae TaxID=595589 RepID=A0A2T0X1H9_9RHOB|nr:LysE family translocator [Hasllibacter halocynthiae]PRY92802.1 threonine/homoserine/homoserine lactone efflux protein [Hasllibacter halocynthiae]